MPKKGYRQTNEHKKKTSTMSKLAWAQPGVKEQRTLITRKTHNRPEFKKKMSRIGHEVQNRTDLIILHHRDFDHNNDLPENRKELSRNEHNKLHAQSGRRGIIFIRNAMDKNIVSRKFYEDYLLYVNQENEGENNGQ